MTSSDGDRVDEDSMAESLETYISDVFDCIVDDGSVDQVTLNAVDWK